MYIDPDNGTLFLKTALDLDKGPISSNLSLVVMATDGVHKSTITVTIDFLYVNEFPPKLILPMKDVTIFENGTRGSHILTVS